MTDTRPPDVTAREAALDAIRAEVIAAVDDADRDDDRLVDAEAIGNIVYEVLRVRHRLAETALLRDAAAEPPTAATLPGLDVERLARALFDAARPDLSWPTWESYRAAFDYPPDDVWTQSARWVAAAYAAAAPSDTGGGE